MLLKYCKFKARIKSSLVSGNRPGETFFIIHPPGQSNVHQNIYLNFQKTNKQKNKKQEYKKQKKLQKKREYLLKINKKNEFKWQNAVPSQNPRNIADNIELISY